MSVGQQLSFVSFEWKEGKLRPLLSVKGFESIKGDPERILEGGERVYASFLKDARLLLKQTDAFRAKKTPIPARMIWRLGNSIFVLTSKLQSLGLQLDELYEHLERDLGVKRKWLEKVITFRRYLPDAELIPSSLNWGKCEKGTRRVAKLLKKREKRPHG